MADLENIRARLTELSGSGRRLSSQRRHGLYTTLTLPGLSDMPAVRDTEIRFSDFGVPSDLSGVRLLDVGANVGAVALEAARRGASVVGLEWRQDRVDLANDIARLFGLDARFWQGDVTDARWEESPPEFWRDDFDAVVCCSVDEYVASPADLYETLRRRLRIGGALYLESNVQRGQSASQTLAMLNVAGFCDIEYLGNGHSGGISRRRKLFRAVAR